MHNNHKNIARTCKNCLSILASYDDTGQGSMMRATTLPPHISIQHIRITYVLSGDHLMGSWIFRELYVFCEHFEHFLPSTFQSQDAKVMGSGGSSQAIHILRISFPTGAASGANLHPVPSDRVDRVDRVLVSWQCRLGLYLRCLCIGSWMGSIFRFAHDWTLLDVLQGQICGVSKD